MKARFTLPVLLVLGFALAAMRSDAAVVDAFVAVGRLRLHAASAKPSTNRTGKVNLAFMALPLISLCFVVDGASKRPWNVVQALNRWSRCGSRGWRRSPSARGRRA